MGSYRDSTLVRSSMVLAGPPVTLPSSQVGHRRPTQNRLSVSVLTRPPVRPLGTRLAQTCRVRPSVTRLSPDGPGTRLRPSCLAYSQVRTPTATPDPSSTPPMTLDFTLGGLNHLPTPTLSVS